MRNIVPQTAPGRRVRVIPVYWDLDPGRGKQGDRVEVDRAIRHRVQDDRRLTRREARIPQKGK
jgi:hypothetical protein